MRAALQSVAVFDHPDRSQRGRTITHAHYFDLGDAPFPEVQADDDAALVQWLSLIHISEPTRQAEISYAVFCLKKKI